MPTAIGHSEADAHLLVELDQIEQRFIEEMDDDFNSANGITVVYELAKWLNTYLEKSEVSAAVLEKGKALFTQWLSIFGERTQARKNRDFARSDEIRDLLKEKGILLDDTPQGTRWRREA